jgi:hypothetical protein
MRLQLYLQVIGFTQASPLLDQCVVEDRLVRDIPTPLRAEMFAKRVPERRFRFLLDILHRLHLIEFPNEVTQTSSASAVPKESTPIAEDEGMATEGAQRAQSFLGPLNLQRSVGTQRLASEEEKEEESTFYILYFCHSNQRSAR